MAGSNLDNLNFKVILDDKDFRSRVSADMKAAKDLNIQLSKLLDMRAKYEKTASGSGDSKRARTVEAEARAYKELAAAMEAVKRARNSTGTRARDISRDYREEARAIEAILKGERAVSAQMEKTERSLGRQNSHLRAQSGLLGELTGMAAAYFSAKGLFNFASSIANVTGEFEMQRAALRNILQDVSGADRIFKQLQNLAIQSPYTFQDLTTYAKQLAAFSIPMESLYDTTKMLADVSAGLGVDMSRMILAYGQVRAASVLRGQEIRQFTEAGVPLLQKLAQQFSVLEGRVVSTGEVFDKVSKRMVSFEMVDKVLRDLTSEGGQFYEMQSVLADTLKGKIMKLKDAYQQLLFNLGESNSGFFHGILDSLVAVVRNFEGIAIVIKGAAIALGAYQLAAIVAGVQTAALSGALRVLAAAWGAVSAAAATNPFGFVISGLIAVGSIIWGVAKGYNELYKKMTALDKAAASYAGSLNEELGKLKVIRAEYKHYAGDAEKLADVKQRILSNYSEYLTNQDREAILTGNLAAVYDKLAASVTNTAKARAMDEGTKNLVTELQNRRSEARDALSKWMDKRKITDYKTRTDLMNYIFGWSAEDLGKEAQEYVKKAFEQIEKNKEREEFASSHGIVGANLTASGDKFAILENLRNLLEESQKDYDESLDFLQKKYAYASRRIESSGDDLLDWQKTANATLGRLYGENAKARDEYIKDATVDFDNYVDGLRNKVKELSGHISDASKNGFEDTKVEVWRKDLTAAKDLLDALGKSYTEVREKAQAAPRATDPNKANIERLENEAKVVEKLIAAYGRLKDIVPESMLPDVMANLFPSVDENIARNIRYDSQIEAIAAKLAALGDEGQKKAAELLVRNGQDATDAFLKAFNAGEKFYNAMADWMAKDFNLTGTGAVFDISKILSEKTARDASVKKRKEELADELELLKGNSQAEAAIRKKYGDEFWNEYVEKGTAAIDALAGKELEANRKTAQEKITSLSEKYAADNLGFDFSNLGKRSLRGLSELRRQVEDELSNIRTGDLELPQGLLDSIDEAGISLDDFGKALEKILSTRLDSIGEEEWKAIGKGLRTGARWASSFGKNLETLAEAADSPSLRQLGEQLQGISSIASSIGEGASAGGAWGALAGGIVGMANALTEALSGNSEAARQARTSAEEYAHALNLLQLELNENYDTMWGERGIAKMAELFADSRAAAQMYTSELEKINRLYDSMSAMDVFGAPTAQKNISASFDDTLKGLQKMQVLTRDRSWLSNWVGFRDEYTQLGRLAPQMWDAAGNLDADAAERFLQTNKSLTDEQKRQIQQVVDLKKQYDDLQNTIDDALGSMVGSLAGDLVEQMIKNFDEAGNAVDDLSGAFQNLGDTILNSLLQSFIIDDILDEFSPRVKAMFEAYSKGEAGAEELASGLDTLVGDINASLQSSGDFVNTMIEAFRSRGLLSAGDSSESGSSLSAGIKAVTEDTASLLASYINAIRADVSYAKVQREGMSSDLKAILGLLPSAPTLAEYLTAIQANTWNTAAASQEILAELRSVVAPYSGGGYAINVNN